MPSPADPTAIEIGSISIRWYALFILLGIIVAIWLSRELARRRGMDPEFILDIAPLVVVSGLIGARAYYVLLRLDYFTDHPSEIINIRLGGMTIHGAIVAGVLMLAYLCHRRGERLLRWSDVDRPRTGPGAGNRALGQLGQSGGIWHAVRPALGGRDQSSAAAG